MSTRSSLTVVSGTTITTSWGNNVRNHIVARTTSDDVTADGQMCLNTSTERLVYYDGSSVFPLAGAMPRARATAGVATPIGNGLLTTPNWSVQDYDTDSMFTPFDNKIYAPLDGTYLVSFKVTFASAATGQREAFVGVSGGATRHAGVSVPVGSTAAAVVLSSAAEVDLTAGAYVQVYMYQTSGAGLNAMNDTTDYFSLRFLGPT